MNQTIEVWKKLMVKRIRKETTVSKKQRVTINKEIN